MTGAAASRRLWAAPAAILALAALVRAVHLYTPRLDADMAVTGLMARHILEGHFPVFFYGQPYCGAIEAYLAAPLFALFGATPLALCLAPYLVSLAFVVLCYLACRDMWGRRAGLLAMLAAALAPYLFIWHSVLPRAAYIEIPTISLLMVWLTFRLVHRRAASGLYFLYGLAAGVGFWTHFLISYALAATALYMVLADWRVLIRRGLPIMLAAFVLGSTPLWLYNLEHSGLTFTYLLGLHKTVGYAEAGKGFLLQAWPTLMGVYWDGTKQAMVPVVSHVLWGMSLVALVYLLWLRRRGLWGLMRQDPSRADGSELWLLLLFFALVITTIKGESVASTRRHFVPMYAALIPLAGYLLDQVWERRRGLALALMVVALGSNLAGSLAVSTLFNSRLRQEAQDQIQWRRELTQALLDRGITTAYALDYWNCHLFTFESGERLIVVQSNQDVDHFFEPHSRRAGQNPRQAYICRREAEATQGSLLAMGAKFQTIKAGPYTCFYDLEPLGTGLEPVSPVGWRATANLRAEDAPYALDQDALTRWSPLRLQDDGQALELDLGRVEPDLRLLRLSSGRDDDHPQGLNLEVSLDGRTWKRVQKYRRLGWPMHWEGDRVEASLHDPRQDFFFQPQPARYLRLIQTGESKVNYWSVQEIALFRAAGRTALDVQALLERARRAGVRALYGDTQLDYHAPPDLRPPRRRPPASPAWPMELGPRQTLPDDLAGVGLALEAWAGPETARFLGARGIAFEQDQAGGFALFWNLRPGPDPERPLPLAGARGRSSRPGPEALALDGKPRTRWDTGRPRQAGDYFEVGLDRALEVSGLVLDSRPSPLDAPLDAPQAVRLAVSPDGSQWREIEHLVVPQGPIIFAGDRLLGAQAGLTRLRFAPVQARAIRLTLDQGHPRQYWSLHEITVLGPRE